MALFFGCHDLAIGGDAVCGRIAVVDLKKVAGQCGAGKGIEKQIVEANGRSTKELEELENKIKSREHGDNKSSEENSRKIDEMRLDLYELVRLERCKISDAYNRAIVALESEIKKAVKDICKNKGIDLVMAIDAVVYYDAEKCLDITNEVVDKMDVSNVSISLDLYQVIR
jgi:Skp family chaperone for outer membrane proteins